MVIRESSLERFVGGPDSSAAFCALALAGVLIFLVAAAVAHYVWHERWPRRSP